MEGLWYESHSSTNQSEIFSLIHSINPVITLVNFRDYILLIIILTDLTFPLKKIILSWKWKWKLLSHVQLFVTPWTIQSRELSRPEYWSGWPFPSPTKGSSQPRDQIQVSYIVGRFFTSWTTREDLLGYCIILGYLILKVKKWIIDFLDTVLGKTNSHPMVFFMNF